MNIGIDIDDTITNSSKIFFKYAKIYNKKKKIKYKIIKNELDQRKAFGWTKSNQKEFSSNYLKIILKETKPYKNVVKSMEILKKLGCNIYFITARNDLEFPDMYEFTKQWLINNNIKFDKLIVNCKDKLEECILNDIKIFIDDNYSTCKKIYDYKKIEVYLYDTNYNKKYNQVEMIRVKNWKNIMKKVKVKI